MEQDCIAGLYRSLGLSVGAEFSPEDVSLLFSKALHVCSNREDACVAMEKVAGGDKSWCCVGENVLDVLLEMEVEREKKEKLYWDLQLLNAGNLNPLCLMDEPGFIDPHIIDSSHHSEEPNTFKKAPNQSERGSHQRGNFHTDGPQRERLEGNQELHEDVRAMRRLKKAARQCWTRLASEGVQSIITSRMPAESLKVGHQAWGCVSLSDVLLLVEVKYDVVTHLLYAEMLQEHYSKNHNDAPLPHSTTWSTSDLEDLAEEALESGDMLCLAELPGAFRIYRAFLGPSFRNSSREKSWSAVSLLYDLHIFRQQEKDSLTALSERLDKDDLRLMCLYIRLATVRAQRENMSYNALLAARQSWEAWPNVQSPCAAEQITLWLYDEEEEQKKDLISAAPQQQAVLQLLVLTQEQERKHLIKMLRRVSLEDLQEPSCTVSQKEESHEQNALRDGCIRRLRQIHADLQTQNEAKTHSKQINHQPGAHIEANMTNRAAMLTHHQLEDCFLLLLSQVMEQQEVRASALLPALRDKSEQQVQVLQDKYESGVEAQQLQLLISEAPPCSGPVPHPDDKFTCEGIPTQVCCSGPEDGPNSRSGYAEALLVDSMRRGTREVDGVQAADENDKQDVCTDCGAAMEELPYLEILCVPDQTSNPHQSLTTEGEAQEEEESSATKSPQSFEKQGSLITLAWSKPPGDDSDYEADAEDGGTGQSEDAESSLKTQVQQNDKRDTVEETSECEETSGEQPREEVEPTHLESDSQLQNEEIALNDKPEMKEDVSRCDLQAHLLINQLSVDVCCGPSNEKLNVNKEIVEMEIFSTETESEPWDPRGLEPLNTEDQMDDSQATVDGRPPERKAIRQSSLMETEQAREPISAIERERTMRNLVDMQRKVEQRQQRDRERQLLRVQERLSIIQSRKADEDLLGLKHTDRLKHLTQDLPQEDKNQQKTVVRERLEQLRRERSYIMQSKRERNTAGFKELLGPVALQGRAVNEGEE